MNERIQTGLEEEKLKYKRKIENIMEGKSKNLQDFLLYMHDLSEKTKYVYMCDVLKFLKFTGKEKEEDLELRDFVSYTLVLLLIRLNSYLMSAVDLGMSDFEISGYSVTAWIKDIKRKLEVSGLKREEADLKKMESKLDKLLSDDKKTELEIDEIANLLK